MASGDVVLETTTGLEVDLALAGAPSDADNDYSWVVQLSGTSGSSDVPASAHIVLGSASNMVGLTVQKGSALGSIPFAPSKTYDIKITEH
jgi:hypothetical protein